MKTLVAGLAVQALVALAGCNRAPPDSTAQGAVRLFLDDMEAASDDPRAMKKAYGLLGPHARANLEERAHRTSALQGRHVEPWEMLAAAHFGLHFRPRPIPPPTVVGDRATVEVTGEDPATERASIVCVHEAGGWRIEPGLPEP